MDNIPSDMRVQNGDNKNSMDMPSESMEEPPEKPDNLTDNMEEPPEKPDSSDKSIEQPPEKMNDKNNIPSNKISTKYYILFSVQSLLLIMLLSYLILSKCNKYTLNTSFKSTSIVVIYVILVIVLSACLTYIETYVTKESNDIKKDNIDNVSVNYSAYKEITENIDITNEEMNSSNSDENVLLLTGNIKSNIENISVKKTGDSSLGDTTSFYGVNSAIVATSGANVTIKNINVETDAIGANGIFSYGGNATTNNNTTDNTTINIYDSTITTKKDNSGGIMTTGGGNTNAYNLTINTSGTSSAAIRSDRGGGNVYVDRGTYTTTGIGSPAIYSTAKIVVENSNLISKASEGIIIEGKNSVEINNCNLTDTNTKLNGLSTTYKNIFLYQSMSGDASEGTSIFTATDSKIITNNGDTFYVTNTSSTINLTNNEIINNDKKGYFLRVSSDSWGQQRF